MASKIPNNTGYTLLELLLAISILGFLFFATLFYVDPAGNRARARDTKRLSDLSTLERIVSEFRLENERYPDDANTLRTSNTLPDAESVSFESSFKGWINEDLQNYNSKLPSDPLNSDIFIYSYFHDGDSFEINARLERLTDRAQNDGGSSPDVYEIGNNLNLITP